MTYIVDCQDDIIFALFWQNALHYTQTKQVFLFVRLLSTFPWLGLPRTFLIEARVPYPFQHGEVALVVTPSIVKSAETPKGVNLSADSHNCFHWLHLVTSQTCLIGNRGHLSQSGGVCDASSRFLASLCNIASRVPFSLFDKAFFLNDIGLRVFFFRSISLSGKVRQLLSSCSWFLQHPIHDKAPQPFGQF